MKPSRSLPDGLAVVLIYATFGTLWILLSDQVVLWLLPEANARALAGTLKGLAFVATTSLLLHVLLRRRGSAPDIAERRRYWLEPTLVVLVAGLTTLALLHAYQHERDLAAERLNNLADLKAQRTADWLRTGRLDAEFIASSAHYADLYRAWRDRSDSKAWDELHKRLQLLAEQRGYLAVSLLDEQGRHLWSSPGAPGASDQLRAAAAAVGDGRIARVDPYQDQAGHARLDYAAPLRHVTPAPIVVLHTDFHGWLAGIRRARPTEAAGAEVLLLRRQGDQILSLEDALPGSGQTPWRAESMKDPELAAASALRGESAADGFVRGLDHRGVAVIAVMRPVPGSDWFLLTKLDQSALLAAFLPVASVNALGGLLILLILLAAGRLWRQRQLLDHAEVARQAQAERLRALNFLAAIADASPDVVFVLDTEQRFVLFNRSGERQAGMAAEDVLGRGVDSVFPPDSIQRMTADNRRVLDDGISLELEETLPLVGGLRTVWISKRPLYDTEGRIIGLLGIARDITERKQAEDALRASEQRFHDIVEATADWVWEVDAEGRFTYASEGVRELLGYAPEEVLGKTPFDFMPPDEAARVAVEFAAVTARREPFRDLDNINLHKDGRRLHISTNGMPILDADGVLVGYRGLDRDITEKRLAQLALEETGNRLRTLVNTLPDLVWLKDIHGVYQACNPRFEAFFGAQEANIIGKTDHDFVPAELADFFRAHDQAAIQANGPCSNEEEVTFASDGHREWLHTIKTPIRDNAGKVIGVLGIARDISERKRAEDELCRSNEELQRFNRATVGRELDMLEMKKTINALSLELGREAPYSLAFLKDAEGVARP